jgi:hypothetical protein
VVTLSFLSSVLKHNYALTKDEAILQPWDESIAELNLQLRSFQMETLPLLKQQGVV